MAYLSGLACDKCGDTLMWKCVWAKNHLTRWAREEGWSIGKKCLCPKCKVQKKKTS